MLSLLCLLSAATPAHADAAPAADATIQRVEAMVWDGHATRQATDEDVRQIRERKAESGKRRSTASCRTPTRSSPAPPAP